MSKKSQYAYVRVDVAAAEAGTLIRVKADGTGEAVKEVPTDDLLRKLREIADKQPHPSVVYVPCHRQHVETWPYYQRWTLGSQPLTNPATVYCQSLGAANVSTTQAATIRNFTALAAKENS